MTNTTNGIGRLCNHIIRNLAVSLIAEKHDLNVKYGNHELIKKLGIELFCGKKTYDKYIKLTDDNYFSVYSYTALTSNLNSNTNFFQTREISNMLYNYLQSDNIKKNIINKNPFTHRYNQNNDLYIHVRLTDTAHLNPGVDYYLNTIKGIIKNINCQKIYISTDDTSHGIIKKIIEEYPITEIINYDEIKTIQFASTCKNIVLSHGSFSAIIGYLAFFSSIHYPEYEKDKIWYGDMFSINGWIKICK
jgi:hypothetical protein